jgi:hypothetical protein
VCHHISNAVYYIQVLIVQCEQWGCERESWEVMAGYWDRKLTVLSTHRGVTLGGGGGGHHAGQNEYGKKQLFSAFIKCLIIEPNERKFTKKL